MAGFLYYALYMSTAEGKFVHVIHLEGTNIFRLSWKEQLIARRQKKFLEEEMNAPLLFAGAALLTALTIALFRRRKY